MSNLIIQIEVTLILTYNIDKKQLLVNATIIMGQICDIHNHISIIIKYSRKKPVTEIPSSSILPSTTLFRTAIVFLFACLASTKSNSK